MKYMNSHRKLIEIYNTDEKVIIDRVYDNYHTEIDIRMMMNVIKETRGMRKRSIDKFIKRLYQEEKNLKYRKVDTIY